MLIYIGYDPKEDLAYKILRESILRYNKSYEIVPLVQQKLRSLGLYKREVDIIDGQQVDKLDGRPFSTEFSFTRFLVPILNNYQGWALFMDSDMFVRGDIDELFDKYCKYDRYAVQVVKHDYSPKATTKMDNQVQTVYRRKNWSSFILWNCDHLANKKLSVEDVNSKEGSWLHQFKWLTDDCIGSIDEAWNWLDGHSSEKIVPKNVHFTTGGPWFSNWRPAREIDAVYAKEWCLFNKRF